MRFLNYLEFISEALTCRSPGALWKKNNGMRPRRSIKIFCRCLAHCSLSCHVSRNCWYRHIYILSWEIITNSSADGLAWLQLLELELRSHGCVHLTCIFLFICFGQITAAGSLFSPAPSALQGEGVGRSGGLHRTRTMNGTCLLERNIYCCIQRRRYCTCMSIRLSG